METEELVEYARCIRLDTIQAITEVRSGHPGGALSCADLLAVLYFDEMNVKPKKPSWERRDRFILSKGHACTAYYAALAERGYFPVEELKTLRQYGSRLQGHPDMLLTPGVDVSSGSLGQGLSIGCGIALAAKLKGEDWRTYVLLGDGEVEEGQVWEAAMTGSCYGLGSLTAIVDANGLQINGQTEGLLGGGALAEKFRANGWQALEIDGHDIVAIKGAFAAARQEAERPTAIIAHTIKGKGVSFMEGQASWHSGVPTLEQYEQAVHELGGKV